MPRTKQQDIFSGISHAFAGLLAVVGTVALIILSASQKTPWHVVGFSIYGASLIFLYAASFAYHFTSAFRGFRESLRSLDYAAISILIAGTYTPLALVTLRGAWGWTMFGTIWGMAILGIVLRFGTEIFRGWVPPTYYLLMGWLVVFALVPLRAVLPAPALWWIFVGGFFYTCGTGFFALERFIQISPRFGTHEIFHLMVILGSACHFVAIYEYV